MCVREIKITLILIHITLYFLHCTASDMAKCTVMIQEDMILIPLYHLPKNGTKM